MAEATYAPRDDTALRAALRDGHGDETLPGYAARLSEVLGIDMESR